MDRQEVFDTAVRGLASQGFQRSMLELEGRCAYRGEDGRRCALGWCMTGAEALTWEGASAYGLPFSIIDRLGGNRSFLSDLQYAHDRGAGPGESSQRGALVTPEAMRRALRLVGERYGLTIPEELSNG